MEDVDKLQATFENLDRLFEALVPFVTSDKQFTLRSFQRMLEPMKHLKEYMKTMEMVKAMQSVMANTTNGTPDLSALSGFLTPEQLQMFELFQSMQDFNE